MKNHPEVAKNLHVPPTEMVTEEHQMRMVETRDWLEKNLLSEAKI
jgi:hypothetical protein